MMMSEIFESVNKTIDRAGEVSRRAFASLCDLDQIKFQDTEQLVKNRLQAAYDAINDAQIASEQLVAMINLANREN